MNLVAKGFLLGWSVAWPPGPINAEILRRALGRGFWNAYLVGLGACCADALWATLVAMGAGALVRGPRVHTALGVVSLALLLFLSFTFFRGAFRARKGHAPPRPLDSTRGGFVLGATLALTSPWNIAFWLAVMGTQESLALQSSLVLSAGVLIGALTWGAIFCAAIRLGARFATPAWEVATQAATGVLMLWFAVRLAMRLFG